MKLDLNKKYLTRIGGIYELLFEKEGMFVGVLVSSGARDGVLMKFTQSGTAIEAGTEFDLVSESTRNMYLNVYDVPHSTQPAASVYFSKEEADRQSSFGRVSCIRVPMIRGQFDE